MHVIDWWLLQRIGHARNIHSQKNWLWLDAFQVIGSNMPGSSNKAGPGALGILEMLKGTCVVVGQLSHPSI